MHDRLHPHPLRPKKHERVFLIHIQHTIHDTYTVLGMLRTASHRPPRGWKKLFTPRERRQMLRRVRVARLRRRRPRCSPSRRYGVPRCTSSHGGSFRRQGTSPIIFYRPTPFWTPALRSRGRLWSVLRETVALAVSVVICPAWLVFVLVVLVGRDVWKRAAACAMAVNAWTETFRVVETNKYCRAWWTHRAWARCWHSPRCLKHAVRTVAQGLRRYSFRP